MKNIFAILRRDLNAYFTTPIGYIFMMVFVTISVGLYITSFFSFPIADMRPYFDNLPIFLCIFIPAITMRVWAEERKENTWEMLLTFLMEARELVLGKFFAALIFFALTLLATVTVPAMLMSLGDPDIGTMISGYMGTLLLAGFFLALGILFSGFFKDQIVAFVVTLLTSFSFFLVGTGFIAGYIDERVPGLGSMLANVLGVFSHFGAFTRGVVDLADIVYFLAWTAIFLVLNVMYIDGRNRPGARTLFLGAVGICVAIGLLFNWLMAGQSFARFDMTEDKIHTISKASKAILASVDTPVQIKLYITPSAKMPTGMKELERDITDKLEELRVASNGAIEFTAVHLEVNNIIAPPTPPSDEEEETEEESIEKRMLEKGVQPFSVSARSNDEVSNKLVYSSIGIAYKDKAEEVLPQVMPQNLQELEYKLVSTIYKLTRDKPPVVALVAPKEAVSMDPQIRAMLMQMGQQIPQSDDPYIYLEQILGVEKYEIQRVELTKESPLPAEYDTLVVINPRRLNDRQRWEINRALHSGKSVVMAVQTYEWDYRATSQGTTIARREETPDVNVLLNEYGLGVSEDILMDTNRVPLTVQSGGNSMMDMLAGRQTLTLPMHVLVNNSSMDPDTSITGRLESIFYLWGTALELNQEKLDELGLQAKSVMSTSERAWTVTNAPELQPSVFTDEPAESEMSQFPLMAIIEGQFPDVYADTERPAWPAAAPPTPNQFGMPPPPPPADTPDPPSLPVTAKSGKMILIGCSEMFRKNFLQAGNLDLFLNAVDALSLSENLVNVRGRKPINRIIDRPTDKQKRNWRLANYGLANLIIAGIGIGFAYKRRTSRNAYTMQWQSKN